MSDTYVVRKGFWATILGKPQKKFFFSGPVTKALPLPLSSLVAITFFNQTKVSKELFFRSGPTFTPSPS